MAKKRNNQIASPKKSPGKKTKRDQKEPQLVAGVGASAGGLEAFSQLLNPLPADTGMSFIFVQHLEPHHESKLAELLSAKTSMRVTQIKNNMNIEPNNVYVIPPNKYLSIENDKLILSERTKSDGIFLPVDHFFKSLANEKKNKAIGIVLSGTASDGTEGLKAIKAEGGLTFAQNTESAKYGGMPKSAADSGNVDIVLPPEKIAKELIRIARHPYIAFAHQMDDEQVSKDDSYTTLFRLLRKNTGVDFKYYKRSTIKRRIQRRMLINKINNIDEYVKLLNDEKEIKELYRDLLINVTNFFRDPDVFETLKKKIFPEVFKNRVSSNSVRIWVPGCATGEEAYSIAISLAGYLEKRTDIKQTDIQIFATDISEASIEKARAGIYAESSVKDIPPEILKKHFVKINETYQINKNIRELCIFARQDITKDPPFSRIDLISCRNLLIYLSQELQKKIIPIFHYSLNPDGFLLLGSSETVGSFGDLFDLYEKKHKMYRKRFAENYFSYKFSYTPRTDKKPEEESFNEAPDLKEIQKETDKLLIEKYTPPGILVSNNFEIKSFRGNVNRYLDPAASGASFNLFKMIRQDISLELHSAFRKIKKSAKVETVEDVKIDLNGSPEIIDIEVVPVKGSSNENFYLIIFNEKSKPAKAVSPPQREDKNKKSRSDSKDLKYNKLKKELLVTRDHLNSIIEEREAANEELRSALEELQSSNEELQSTNEEMETAREELQSTNEELITVNEELENSNFTISETNNDLLNLLSSINQPIIMLDSNLKIRRFTAKAEQVWNLISSDIGRPINNIKPNFEISDLKENILEVLNTLDTKEFDIKDNNNKWYSVKIRPYKTTENKIEGVVITFYDINALKENNLTAIINNEFSKAVIDTVRESLLVLDGDLKVVRANKSFYNSFRMTEKTTVGKFIFDLGGQWDIPLLKKLLEEIIPENSQFEDYEVEHVFPGIGKKKMMLNARRIEGSNERDELILLAIEEVK